MASKALLSDAKTVIEDWLDPSEVNLDVQILLVGGAMGLCLVGLLHNLLTIIETLNGLLIGTLMVMGVWQAIVRRPTLFSLDRAVRRRVPATASDCMLHGSATVLFAAGWAIVQLEPGSYAIRRGAIELSEGRRDAIAARGSAGRLSAVGRSLLPRASLERAVQRCVQPRD